MDVNKPNKVTRTYTQKLVAEPSRVFPLLCPVREAEWLERWKPILVRSESGFAEVGCVFTTPASPSNAIWYVARHEPRDFFIEMIKISPEVTACKLSIQLSETPDGCEAIVTYTHTSLGPDGDLFVADFTEDYYRAFMQDWEKRLNFFLKTGTIFCSSNRE
jgi:hypothetical protein